MSLLRIFLLLPLFLFAADGEDLHFSDVKALMNQVFSQHIDHKKISAQIIAQSFWNFIDQFDPEKIYLLESEVRPWIEKDDLQWMQIMSAYKKNEFGAYSELNKVIQDSITRSRGIRSRLYETPEKLFSLSPHPLKETFAANNHDLEEQIQDLIVSFIAKQKERFGQEAVMGKQGATLDKFERKMRAFETPYLFVNSSGQPLSESQQESLLVLHILKSLAKSLDSHTAFIDKAEAYDMRVRLEKGGTLGVGLVLEDGLEGVVVEGTVTDSPAGRINRIQKGDRIIAINDKVVKDRSLDEVTDILHRDDKGGIKLSFEREEEGAFSRYTLALLKEPIPAQETRVDVSYTYFGEGIIGVIALHSFYEGEGGSSEKDVRDAILHLERIAPLEGLILDLRENRGGYLTQAVKVAGLFITNGVVAISRFADGSEKIYRDVEGKTTFDGPLLILVSRETASAAEIVAQALQDYGVAVVAGDDHTFGKGTIQSQTVTEGTGAVYFKVTVGKYYTVSGKTPEEKGVKSNIVIPGPTMLNGDNTSLQEVSISPADTVEPEFLDDLGDVRPETKPWFLKYYIPKLQPPEDHWNKVLPQLVKNSHERIKNNKNYQLLLKKKSGAAESEEAGEEDEDEGFLLKRPQNSGVNDIQLDEAVQVMRDMIRMEEGDK